MDLRTLNRQADQIYNPQIRNVQQQIGQVPGLYDPQREALRQAQRNAFRDIDAQAADTGMFYSGRPIEGQLRYTSETFTPQMAQIDQAQQQQLSGLAQALANLQIERGQSVLSRYDTGQQMSQAARLSREQLASQQRIAREQNRATLQAARI